MRMKARIIALVLIIIAAAGFTACVPKENNDRNDTRTRLKISYYLAGYGDKWLRDAAAVFEAENPDVKIVLDGNYNMQFSLEVRLKAAELGDSVSDIFTDISGIDLINFINKGWVEDLTGLYGQETEDGIKLSEAVLPQAMEQMKLRDGYYGVPWVSSVTGFVYNSKMFRDNNWQVPGTLNDFLTLCEKIKTANIKAGNKTVAPLVYSGASEQGYFQHLLRAWFLMYQGEKDFLDFYKYNSPEVFKMQGRLKAYEALGTILGNRYAMAGSTVTDYLSAQRSFIMGEAAMISCGSWLETEMSGFIKEFPNFEMKIMPTPVIYASESNGKYFSLDGKEILDGCTSTGGSFFIPAKAAQKELAKKFLLFMSSRRMLNVFVKGAGAPRPFIYPNDTDWSGLTPFQESVMECYQQAYCISASSWHPLALEGRVVEYPNGRYSAYLGNAVSPQNGLDRARELYDEDYDIVSRVFQLHNG